MDRGCTNAVSLDEPPLQKDPSTQRTDKNTSTLDEGNAAHLTGSENAAVVAAASRQQVLEDGERVRPNNQFDSRDSVEVQQ